MKKCVEMCVNVFKMLKSVLEMPYQTGCKYLYSKMEKKRYRSKEAGSATERQHTDCQPVW